MRCLRNCSAVVGVVLISATLDGQVMLRDVSCTITGTVSTYAVQHGDSLISVAARFGVDPTALAEDNRLRPGTVLRAGDALRVDNRHIVPAELNDGILINIPQRMLFVARENRLAGAYPIAVGQSDWQTPIGTFAIGTKEIDPTWDVPVSIQREMAGAGRPVLTAVPPGPENPLGDRWLGLKDISVGIHGTNQPTSVFRFTTHGCIRLHPDDVRQLFELVEVGSPVTIVYQPVLVAVDEQGQAWLEVHPDPYGRVGDLSRLAGVLLRDAGVPDAANATGVRRCVRERRGRPCQVAP
jgi:L,D-transpeptidase ErfK/SrfK